MNRTVNLFSKILVNKRGITSTIFKMVIFFYSYIKP